MRATIISTDAIVDIDAVGHDGQTKARVWEGFTETGVAFLAYIPLVQVRTDADNSQFERELLEHQRPSQDTLAAIDARHIR